MSVKNVFVISDPGLDPDDILAAMLLSKMQEKGMVKLLGAIANYSPSLLRARLLKGVFNELGVDVLVAQGTDCNSNHQPREYEFDFPLADEVDIFEADLLKIILHRAEDKSVTLLLISGLTDIWQAVQRYPDLIRRKVRGVYLMGGAHWEGDKLIVDKTASNNRFDVTLDAQMVYDFFIEQDISLNVLTRNAAYAANITPTFYERIKDINQVSRHLVKIQRLAMDAFWDFACSNPSEHRQNRQWFCKTFCNQEDIPLGADESPWQYVKKLAIYDPLTALWMCYPDLFAPSARTFNGTTHQIVGLSAEENGVPNGSELISVIESLVV